MSEHYTKESEGKVGTIFTEEEARKAHHLATADPERDGLMTGPAHEEKYGLERAEASAANWRAHGVHPIENRALMPGEDGAENLRGRVSPDVLENSSDSSAKETADSPRSPRK